MPVAKTIDDIPFNTLAPGVIWHLKGFEPEQVHEAKRLLDLRAASAGYVATMRSFPAVHLFLGYTPEQLEARRERKKGNAVPVGKPGRPVGLEGMMLRALEIGQHVILPLGDRHIRTLRNLASETGKRLERKFKVENLDGGHFKITRVR